MTAVDEGKVLGVDGGGVGGGGGGLGVVNDGYTPDGGGREAAAEPKRKVSISSEALQADAERQRKVSAGSHGPHPHPHQHQHQHPHPRCAKSPNGAAANDGPPPQPPPPLQTLDMDHLQKMAAAQNNVSWWYLLCTKCRQKETGPGWEPSGWQSVCPYPFCPTYRHVARCVALGLVVLLGWGVALSIIGDDAAPGGQLFDIILLVVCAHFAGYLFRMINMPGLIGMLLVGVLFQNAGLIHIHGGYMHMCAILRRMALVNILVRAGLDLDPGAMRRLFWTTLRMGLVPWAVEAAVVSAAGHALLALPWMWALLVGSVVAAVSPAVVVPCLIRLRGKGYGVAKGIPTVVIAVSGIDDAASVAAFGILASVMFSQNSLLYNIALGPISIVAGVGFGVFWGLLSKFIPEKGDPFVVPLRTLMLVCGGLIAVFGFEHVQLEGAGPLGVVAAAFVSSWVWSTQGWDVEHNPVATAFEIFWMVFEPILFSLTGTQIKFHEIDNKIWSYGVPTIIVACILRQIATVVVGIGARLNFKEKVFFAVAWMAKASVQAALAPVALDVVRGWGPPRSDGPERDHAQTVLMMCVLSIALTAPTGAVLITIVGPRLLARTAPGPPPDWRASSRPSLRDITVIDEGNEADDIERRPSRKTSRCSLTSASASASASAPAAPGHRLAPPPNLVVTQQP